VRKFLKHVLRHAAQHGARWKTAAALVLIGALVVALLGRAGPEPGREGLGTERTPQSAVAIDAAKLGTHPVIYGSIYVDKFYELNASTRTFSADGSFWLEWPASVEQIIQDNNVAIDSLVRLKNRIETWDSTLELDTAEPIELSAGRFQQRYTFSSRFYDDEINFRRAPFNTLTLPIVVELMPEVMTSKYADVLLLPQRKVGALVGESGHIIGYELTADSLQSVQQSYRNKFGSWHAPKRSQLRLEVAYSANTWSAFISWMLPLLIVNSLVLMAPSVEGSLGDIRLAIPSTALLTLIFLQQSYHSQLPKLPYTTYLDDLFSCSYVMAMALFALFTWGANAYSKAPASHKAEVMKRINVVDGMFQTLSISMFVGMATVGWIVK
jgi:hypothetical protein